MIEKENTHSVVYWSRVDSIINFLLYNPRYLRAQRTGELTERVILLFKKDKIEISIRQAQRYVKEAKSEFRKASRSDIKAKILSAEFARMSLIERCRTANDYKCELKTLQDLAALQGLYPDKNINIKAQLLLKNVDLSKLSDAQLEKIKGGQDLQTVMMNPN